MKKKKYLRMTYHLYDDDYLINLLENQAKEGWFLSSINNYVISFKKGEPQNLKYQIDYNKPTHEYSKVIEELGYQIVCTFSDAQNIIYCHTNRNAPDLQTDSTAKLLSMISYFSLKKAMGQLGLAIMFGISFYIKTNEFLNLIHHFSLASIFSHTSDYIGLGIYLMISLGYFISSIFTLSMPKTYQKQLNNHYQELKLNLPILKIYQFSQVFINFLFIIFFISLLITSTNMKPYISIIIGLSLCIYLIIYYICSPRQHYRTIQIITLITLLFMNVGIYQSKVFNIEPIEKDLYYQNDVDDFLHHKTKDIFVHSQYTDIYSDYYENYTRCLNKDIAYIIFKDNIILADRWYRREQQSSLNQNIPYLSFEESLKNMQNYQTGLVEQCYFNNKYMICIKDNDVLMIQKQSEDQFIQNILENYF